MRTILAALVKSPVFRKQYIRVVVLETWKQQMGPLVVKYTKRLTIRKNILCIYVSSDALKHELRYSKDKIIAFMNEALEEQLISDVQIR
jgi:hypothetical protein